MCTSNVLPRCSDKSKGAQQLWQLVASIKQRIEALIDSGKQGARIGAVKAVQRIILVQTRANADPRVCRFIFFSPSSKTAK